MNVNEIVATLGDIGRGFPTWLLWMTLWTAGLLAVAWLMDWALRRVAEPGLRMALYLVVLIRVALPVDWQTPVGVFDGPTSTQATMPAVSDVPATGEPFVIATESTASAPVVASAARPIDALGLGILSVYLAGALGLLVVVYRRMRRTGEVLGQSKPTTVQHGITVHAHAHAGPMVVGLRRPAIVVPRAILESTEAGVLDAVLRHEQAHARHRDGISAFAMAVLCAIAWPLVPVWLAVARVRLLMELRADAAAVRTCDAPVVRGYRRLLLDLAQQRWPVHVLAPGLDPVAALRARLAAMANRPRTPWLLQLVFVVPLAIALLVFTARRSVDDLTSAAPVSVAEPTPILESSLAAADGLVYAPLDVLYPHCREHEALPLVPVLGDPAEQARMRGMLGPLVHVTRARQPDQIGLLDAVAESLLHGSQRVDGIARAEAEYMIGLGLAANGRTADAAHHIGEAAWLSASAKYDYLAAECAAAMVVVLHGVGPKADVDAWGRHAAAATRRIGLAGPMAMEMYRVQAKMADGSGDHQAAELARDLADAIDAKCEVVAGMPAAVSATSPVSATPSGP